MTFATASLFVLASLVPDAKGYFIYRPLISPGIQQNQLQHNREVTLIDDIRIVKSLHLVSGCRSDFMTDTISARFSRPGFLPGFKPTTTTTQSYLSDFDFPSAMPEKPQMTTEERMETSADDFIESMTAALGEGVEEPPELEELRQLRKSSSKADPPALALKIYELMIERGMRYDEAPETGTLTPTEFNIPDNLQVKEVQEEFAYLYRYGMMLMDRGLLTVDQVKETVMERLIKRTGLTPEEFDSWLGY